MVTTVINTEVVNCIVDTGSPVTVVDFSVTDASSLTNKTFENIHNMSGSVVRCRTSKTDIEIENGGLKKGKPLFVKNHKVYATDLRAINDNYSKKYNIRGIIGMDIISKTHWLCL